MSWSVLGSGMNASASDFATLPNGDLVAGGGFTVVNGAVSTYMAQLGRPRSGGSAPATSVGP